MPSQLTNSSPEEHRELHFGESNKILKIWRETCHQTPLEVGASSTNGASSPAEPLQTWTCPTPLVYWVGD